MKFKYILFILVFAYSLIGFKANAQEERRFVRRGVDKMEQEKYGEAEKEFRKALEETPTSFEAGYNLASSLFKQEKYEEALQQLKGAEPFTQDPKKTASLYHNIGNSLLHQQQIDPAIEAYKNSLRLNPTDDETRYNLIAAMKMKEEQDNQDDQQQDKEQQEEQQQDKEKQEQQQEQKEQEKEQQDQRQQQQQEERQQELDKENAERLLNAIEQDEKELMEKLQKEKHKEQQPVKIDKNW